jgi:hypothetical protein
MSHLIDDVGYEKGKSIFKSSVTSPPSILFPNYHFFIKIILENRIKIPFSSQESSLIESIIKIGVGDIFSS